MAQRITKHSTRLSQVHEGALDTPFKPGDRVQTIDGLPGRVLFVSASLAPGVTEYEIALDSGMGQGTYTASQLRPIPADYRGGSSPVPPGLLPAGVTAAIEAEGAETHLASDDYPEMGSVLTDRPDPGRLHKVIGGLRKTAADSYRGDHDPREEDYNGGEADSGTYWAEPGQQDWMHENEPQEPAPPPPWEAAMESPVLARLAQMEEARHLFGTVRQEIVPAHRHATTINGTQVDAHGDAPEHGTVPRATDPDSYDDRSTEGDGDPRWSGQDDPQMRDKNGAAVGMYPEGMSAGGGPGLEIGAFTAHKYGEVEGTHATEQHLINEHGVTPAELSDLRLRSWHTYPQELHSAHTRVSGGRPLDDWHGSTWLAHGRPMDASELQGHLAYQHGVHLPANYAPGEMAREHNNEHERNEFAAPGENHGRGGEPGWGAPEAPDEYGPDDDTAATYQAHSGPIDPVFGSRHVPWTGHERDELHDWEAAQTAGWGDFVNRTHFTNKTPADESDPGAVEEMQAEGGLHAPESWQNSFRPQMPGAGGDEQSRPGPEGTEKFDTEEHGDVATPEDHRDQYRYDQGAGWAYHTLSHLAQGAWSTPGGSEMGEDETASYQPFDSSRWMDSPSGHPEYSRRPVEMAPIDEEYSRWAGDADPNQHRSGEHGLFHHTLSFQREAVSNEQWEWHLRTNHGWGEEGIDRLRAGGNRPSDMHEALHGAGLADHRHAGGPEEFRDSMREHSLNNMFGPDVTTQKGRHGFPGEDLTWPQQGGHAHPHGEPMVGLVQSVEPRPPTHPDEYEHTNPDRFRRMMSALDPPHPHDDDASSLDSGPAEGDEEFPEAHDDLDDPDAPVPPQAWPMAGSPVNEGGPAYTQGRDDGNRGRKFPPPPPPPMPAGMDGEDGAPGSGDPNDPDDADGTGKKITLEVKAHLDAFTAAAHDPRFRFEFTAAWSDVVAKAQRIRRQGKVRITHASAGMVIGAVSGDHDVYESGIQRPPHKPQTIQHWACGCPWASFHQDKSLGTRYAGRPCSHVMALQFEAQARTMFGREMTADPGIANHEVVVKSMPPWTPSGWSQTWLAPSASLHTATPDEAQDWNLSPEEREERWPQLLAGLHNTPVGLRCHYKHGGPCEMRGPDRIAESLNHPRPRTFYSEIEENPHFNPDEPWDSNAKATHVMNGYLGPKLTGQLHFTRSDDGRAFNVENLHTAQGSQGNGIASAMMDDLYHHALGHRGWINHGMRTAEGNSWWSNYREPFPEINTHHAHPDAGWQKYWPVAGVADEAEYNHLNSGGRGAHSQPPAYDRDGFPDQDHDDMWTHALGLTPAQRATAALTAAGEDPGEISALAALAGITADLSPSDAMIWRHLDTAHAGGHDAARNMGISPWRYHDKLHEQRAAVSIPHAHDEEPGEPEGLHPVTADQANAPWGSSNVAQHPPGKPYGATQPKDPTKSPASYGPLSGPDPENWGGIQEDSIFQSPLTNEASVRPLPGDVTWPDMSEWQPASQEDQETHPYSDRSSTGGPSTSITPHDPQGIRMEEHLDDYPFPDERAPRLWGDQLRDHPDETAHFTHYEATPERLHDHLLTDHGYPADQLSDERGPGADLHRSAHDWEATEGVNPWRPRAQAFERGLADYEDTIPGAAHYHAPPPGQPIDPVFGAVRQAAGTAFPYHGTIPQLDGALAELRDEPEPALPSTTGDDDIEATAAADGTIGGGDAGSGRDSQAPADVASLGEFGASAMGDQSAAEGLTDQAQEPSVISQEPGMGSADEPLSPADPSIQTIGQQQWSGGGADSDEVTAEPGDAQGDMNDIVAAFQRSAAARQFGGGPGAGGQASDGDIATAARQFLKTADVLPDKEAAELIAEGRGQRARNLGLLRLEGTHYEEEEDDLARRGVSLDDYDDDVISV